MTRRFPGARHRSDMPRARGSQVAEGLRGVPPHPCAAKLPRGQSATQLSCECGSPLFLRVLTWCRGYAGGGTGYRWLVVATPAAVDVGRIDAAAAREGAAVVGKRNPGVLIIREGHGGGPSTGPPCSSTAIEMVLSLMPLFCPDRYRPIIEGLPTRALPYRPPMPGPSNGTRSSTTPTSTAPADRGRSLRHCRPARRHRPHRPDHRIPPPLPCLAPAHQPPVRPVSMGGRSSLFR